MKEFVLSVLKLHPVIYTPGDYHCFQVLEAKFDGSGLVFPDGNRWPQSALTSAKNFEFLTSFFSFSV